LLAVIAPRAADEFLEIGPGLGALTLPLAGRSKAVRAVEIDARLADALRRRAPANVEVILGDALETDLAPLLPDGGRVAGNLPYYVGSPLLRRIVALHARAADAHVLIQAEVAERVASPPGVKAYGILSVLAQLVADVSVPLRLAPRSFEPPPEVESAVLRLAFRRPAPEVDLEGFRKFLDGAFAHRRKTLANNLTPIWPNLKEHLKLHDIEGARRPETLSVVEFLGLYESLRATVTV
jgi:16S rRNA (adenine1518-N6/adenine1519-N6)-dimethyltransferase